MRDLDWARATLGVAPDASAQAVREAYVDLMKVWHPDKHHNDARLRRKAEDKVKEINDAYELMKQAASRPAREDHVTDSQASTPSQPPPASSRHSRDSSEAGGESPPRPRAVPTESPNATGYAPDQSTKVRRDGMEGAARFLAWAIGFVAASSLVWVVCRREKPNEAYEGAPSPYIQVAPARAPTTLPTTEGETTIPLASAPTPDELAWAQGGGHAATRDDSRTEAGTRGKRAEVAKRATRPSSTDRFTVGSTKEEVAAVQGTPSSVIGDTWMYDFSTVEFSHGRVVTYSNASHNLKVVVRPRTVVTSGKFGIGSTADEVLAAQGTPSSVLGDTWMYEFSTVEFSNGRVVGYSNASRNLKLQ